MSSSHGSILQQVLEYDFLRFTYGDLHGIARSKMVANRNVHKFINGFGCYAGFYAFGPRGDYVSIQKVEDLGLPNCLVKPDPSTLHHVAWSGDGKYKIGQILGESNWLHDGTPQQACPRFVANKQLEKLKNIGYELLSGCEVEFALVDAKSLAPVFKGLEIYNSVVLAEQESVICDIDQLLWKSGINVEKSHAEHGSGQFEMSLNPERGIKAADDVFIFKNGVKEICFKRGLRAIFMARPWEEFANNGLHFNHSLWDASGGNVLHDPEAEACLSEVGKHWIAGILKHANALCAFLSPTVNCYRRLHELWSPDKADWGLENRTAAVRTKPYESTIYFENRLPSGSCNPYLMLAATVAAGMDGLVNKIPIPKAMDPQAVPLPSTLVEALDALKADSYLIEAMGQEFVDWFLKEKTEVELEKLKSSDIKNFVPEHLANERELYMEYL